MFFLDTEEALDIAPAPLPNSGLLHPRRPGKKPTWPVEVDKTHPFAMAISGYCVDSGLHNNSLLPVSIVENGGIESVTNGVKSLYSPTLSDRLFLQHPIKLHKVSDGTTLVCSFYCESIQHWGSPIGFGYTLGSTGTRVEVSADDTGQIFLQYMGSWQKSYVHDFPVGGWVRFVGRIWYNAGSNRVDCDFSFSHNGQIYQDSAINIGDSTGEQSWGVISVGASQFGTSRGFVGAVDHGFLLPYLMSDEEINRYLSDPYQFLKPKLDVLPIQSRNVPGGFSLPTSVTRPRRPGQKPTWPVVVDLTRRYAPRHFILPTTVAYDVASRNLLQAVSNAKILNRTIDLSGTSDKFDWPIPLNVSGGDFTLLARLRIDNSDYTGIISGRSAAEWSTSVGFSIRCGGGSIQAQCGTGSTTSFSDDFNSYNTWFDFAYVHRVGGVGSLLLNGTDIGSYSTRNTCQAFTPSTAIGRIGTYYDMASNRSLNGAFDYLMIIPGALSDLDINKIHADPYQFLIPKL